MKLILCSGKTLCRKYYRLQGWYGFVVVGFCFVFNTLSVSVPVLLVRLLWEGGED